MHQLMKLEKWLVKILETIITLFFGIILLTTISLVILRYVFNSGIYGGNELMSYLFVYTTSLGAAISIGTDNHIKITFLVDLFPPLMQKIIHGFGYLAIGFLNVTLIFMSIPWIKQVGSFESPTLRIPNALVQFGVPFGCSFAILFCLIRFIDIFTGEKHVASTR